jgi:scyllo-inositol 2-dehydrogenase (NADP+)
MKRLRVALIGYGLAGSAFHAPLISAAPGFSLTTIVTSDPQRQEQARRDHPEALVIPRADDLWTRAAEHALAVVAAPNRVHVPLARQALDCGLAVVVDKPLATNAADAHALVEEARGQLLTVFHNRRWDSDYLTLRKLLASGALGEITRYESRFERWRPRLKPGAWRETADPAAGGGVLLDLGSHLVDQALQLFGPLSHVYGEIDNRRDAAGDDDAFLVLRHRSGTYSHLWTSLFAAAPGPRLRVLGTSAGYVVDEVDGQEAALRSGVRPNDGDEWGVEPESRWGRVSRGERMEAVPTEPGAWPRFYVALERAIRQGGPPPVDPADAVAVLAVLDAARVSAAERRVIALPP